MGAEACENKGASEVDNEGSRACQRKWQRRGRDRRQELDCRRPQRRKPRHYQNTRERHAEPRPVLGAPTECGRYHQIDGSVLKEVHTVRKEGNGADCESHHELDAEISEIERGNENDGAAEWIILEHTQALLDEMKKSWLPRGRWDGGEPTSGVAFKPGDVSAH